MCPGVIEDTKHFIFECVDIQNICNILSAAIRFYIQWKNLS